MVRRAESDTNAAQSPNVAAEALWWAGLFLFTTVLVMVGGVLLNYNAVTDVPQAVWIVIAAACGAALLATAVGIGLHLQGQAGAKGRVVDREGRRESRRLLRSTVGIPYLAYLVALVIGVPAGRYGLRGADLNSFFQGAAPLIGAVLVALVIEAPKGGGDDPLRRLRRAVGLAFILSGALLGIVGLLPGVGYLYACLFLAVTASLFASAAVMMTLVLMPGGGASGVRRMVAEVRQQAGNIRE